MRVLISGGGTGGHVNPAVAIANHLRDKNKNIQIIFAGTEKGLESKVIPKEGYKLYYLKVKGFKRKFSVSNSFSNIDAAIKAIEAIGPGRNILLIAGGYDKDADFSDFIRAAKGRAKKLLLLGETSEAIKDNALNQGFAENDIVITGGMGEAVRLSFESAGAGDTILLSPACASWDMYKNFEERGAHFKSLVFELEAGK